MKITAIQKGALYASVVGIICVIGFRVGVLERKPSDMNAILALLGTYAVLALVVERTLEVIISAWRGQVTTQLFSVRESARLRLEAAPRDFGLQQVAAEADLELAVHRGETQKIALRLGVLFGLIISATGIRTLDVFVTVPTETDALALYTFVDLVVTAGMLGGGSKAIHQIMKAVKGILGGDQERDAQLLKTVVIPPVSPGAPTSNV